jgi:hypothetical protein
VVIALLATAALVAGVDNTSSGSVTGPELSLNFDGADPMTSLGGASLTVQPVTANGGAVTSVPGRDGVGGAVQLPAYAASNARYAALRVTDATGADDLNPTTATFSFGADFTLDAPSQGTSNKDNGNNLMQRGLYASPSQYKLQVDGGRPSCRIKGTGGVVMASSTRLVVPGEWYHAMCTRSGTTVTLVVTHLSDGVSYTYRKTGNPGSVRFLTQSLPLSVGAKLSSTGQILTSDSDQFNGDVDNVSLDIAP